MAEGEWSLVSSYTLAKMVALSPSRIRQMTLEGHITRAGKNTFDLLSLYLRYSAISKSRLQGL